ncbi:ATP-dependent DNA helicase [Candidatus Woesearchaeota archaeon]|nr:ATP-dependent DNA helicase [Candidatus Woesearchaeota archaeon]
MTETNDEIKPNNTEINESDINDTLKTNKTEPDDKINQDNLEVNDILFPYEKIRDEQSLLIKDIISALKEKKNLIANAPTGLGKTAAALSPVLKFALDNNLTVFFLTSRQTQHKIAIETLKNIKRIHGVKFEAADIIGKKWMCAVPNISALYSNEFVEYCKNMRETNKCAHYTKTREKDLKLTVEAKKTIEDLRLEIRDSEDIVNFSSEFNLCPYEISLELAKKAKVIIGDYFYVFNPYISELFFKKANIEIEKTIIVVDEAHNLPERIRELATSRLTNFMVSRAVKEAKKYGFNETLANLNLIQNLINELSNKINVTDGVTNGVKNNITVGANSFNNSSKGFSSSNRMYNPETKITKEEFVNLINIEKDYEQLIEDFEVIAETVREKQKRSFIGSIAAFLEAWKGEDEGFTRLLKLENTKEGLLTTLSYTCLDTSIITGQIIDNAYSTILMSGTLTPTFMYRDLLGMKRCIEKEYKSPFPEKNKLSLIVPLTTTKYEQRSTAQYENIGKISADLVNKIKGNVFVFFSSYKIRDSIYLSFMNECKKTIFLEDSKMSKEQKLEMLERFKKYKKSGAVLLGVTSGSFGEGIDMPGDLLNGVIIVGLPLGVPDLETRELIAYFDKKYKKGWDYGYLFPAFQKTLQNAGRCIRSETDRGVIVFLDERYIWPMYKRCFPADYKTIIAKDYGRIIENFFEEKI